MLIGLVVVVLVLAKRRGLFTSLWHQREEGMGVSFRSDTDLILVFLFLRKTTWLSC